MKNKLHLSARLSLMALASLALALAFSGSTAARPTVSGSTSNAITKQSIAASLQTAAGSALGQRSAAKTSQLPIISSGPSRVGALPILPVLPRPKAPQVVLYDQYNNPNG